MIGHRDGKIMWVCDSCYKVIAETTFEDPTKIVVDLREDQFTNMTSSWEPGAHFCGQECFNKYKPTKRGKNRLVA